MTLHLTSADTRRIAAAAEALLSPRAGPDPEAWWLAAEGRVRALFPRANVMLTFPDSRRLRSASESVDAAALRRLEELAAADERTGLFAIPDPIVQPWLDHRRRRRLGVWTEAGNAAYLATLGLDARRSVFYNEGLLNARLYHYAGLSSDSSSGEMFVTLGYDRGRTPCFGDHDVDVLSLLLPAFRTGHHALATFGRHQAALAATLDDLSDALLVVGADGRELHRNAALRRTLAAEPEHDAVVGAMAGAAAAVRAARTAGLALAGRPAPAAERAVATALARYVVRAWLAPEEVWRAPGVVLVSLTASRDAAHGAAALPDAGAVARALGLTAREGEVARLLAQRLTSAELAAALGISVHTARRHTEKVMQKLGVHSRQALAARVRGAGAAD